MCLIIKSSKSLLCACSSPCPSRLFFTSIFAANI
nr:MAG TPA: hypothetical protein [Bacteriophage sp.]